MSHYEEKFGSLERVYGEPVTCMLRELHICVIGVGGVGSWTAEALARTGVGSITLVDADEITRGNTNRQIHALESTLGKSKVEVMKLRILDINPECQVNVINQYLDEENHREILEAGYDAVIDAIDRIKYKAMIIYCCKRNKIPVITTGGAGGLMDPTKIEVADLARTWNDPLAASVRNRLRYKYSFARDIKKTFGIPCVYSSEQQRYPDKAGKVGYAKPGVAGLSLDCNFGYGSSVAVTASFGFATAAGVIDLVVKKKKIGMATK